MIAAIMMIVIGICFSVGYAQQQVPESVYLYEQVKALMPPLEVDGVPLQGLSLCKLAARCTKEEQPFLAMPKDLLKSGEQEGCDLTQVKVAYGGYCWAGVTDHIKGPHLAPSYGPLVSCKEGFWGETWLMFNNIGKVNWKPSLDGEQAGQAWLRNLPPVVKVWSAGKPLIPYEWLNDLPPHP